MLLCMLMALAMAVGAAGMTGMAAWADGETGDDASISVNDSIIDTENLLGEDVATVNDAIESTKQTTGVSVKLLYLPKFREGTDPEQWAKQTLDSTDPEANTVMLAVATQDGNLVVAVSSNSDAWLRDQDTVRKLSDAAVGPILANSSDPDWAGSAKAMMDAIVTARKTSTSRGATMVGVAVFAGALVVVAGVCVAVIVIRRRRGRRHAAKRGIGRRRKAKRQTSESVAARRRDRAGRPGRHSHRPAAVFADAARNGTDAPADAASDETVTNASGVIQETSSRERESGNHEQAN